MKKLLSVVPVLLLFAMIGTPNARADSYVPTFTCTYDCFELTAGAPTAPDVSFPAPTQIDITIGSDLFSATLPAPDSPADAYEWDLYSTIENGTHFDTFEVGGTAADTVESSGVPYYGDGVDGLLTFSPVTSATPEPPPILLMLLGVGLIFFMRRRLLMRIPLTT